MWPLFVVSLAIPGLIYTHTHLSFQSHNDVASLNQIVVSANQFDEQSTDIRNEEIVLQLSEHKKRIIPAHKRHITYNIIYAIWRSLRSRHRGREGKKECMLCRDECESVSHIIVGMSSIW